MAFSTWKKPQRWVLLTFRKRSWLGPLPSVWKEGETEARIETEERQSHYVCFNLTFLVLGIWDTAGQERFDSMTKIYYRGAEAAIVCYDLTDKNSFERARFWVDELLMNVENCRIYLVGTKADLVDEFGRGKPADDIAHFARSIDATLNIETSSKTGKAVEDLFYAVAENWVKDHPEATGGIPRTTLGNTLDNPNNIEECACLI
eukprot:TRINITY_DN1084_c0_g1_i2.p1 TRINITY_DN1084_c0_g1~~TRINITY_DN1084_c0_g1_i2.p1  ORF type:complete len:204 (+),score=41.51 TRINITY_DN1084_c0_g1_i2:120-731(+)